MPITDGVFDGLSREALIKVILRKNKTIERRDRQIDRLKKRMKFERDLVKFAMDWLADIHEEADALLTKTNADPDPAKPSESAPVTLDGLESDR